MTDRRNPNSVHLVHNENLTIEEKRGVRHVAHCTVYCKVVLQQSVGNPRRIEIHNVYQKFVLAEFLSRTTQRILPWKFETLQRRQQF